MIPAEPDPVCTGVGIEMKSFAIPNVLTIAGSDSGGGAGIQADLKAFSALGVYGASVITAVTAQNTHTVSAIHPIPNDVIAAQIDAVLTDIAIHAIKVGMLGSVDIIETVAQALSRYPTIPLVVDPVMISKSGSALLPMNAVAALKQQILPRAYLITPNLPEAAALVGLDEPTTIDGMYALLPKLHELGAKHVLLKGGHLEGDNDAVDLLSDGKHVQAYRAKRINTQNTHGTGCTLSSAITALLAKHLSLDAAVSQAKVYLSESIASADQLDVGSGHGPLHHFATLWNSTSDVREY